MKTETAAPTARATRFDWSDPLLLDAQLSEEERMVRETARAYGQERLAPRVLEAFRHEKTDPAIFREMGELDLLGVVIPEQYGGADSPFQPFSRMNPRISSASSLAQTMKTSAIGLLVIQVLLPVSA